MRRNKLLALTVFATFGFNTISDASAIITRHDVSDEEYVVDDADYPELIDLFYPGDCIGTFITDTTLLTVAHCAEDLRESDSLIVNGEPLGIDTIMLHPDYNGWNNDVALIRMESATEGITPYAIYKGTDELGQTLTLVGRGVHATGQEGEPGGSTDGLLRRATNVVSFTSNQWLEVYFEDPDGTDELTDLEGVGAAGDSGSPAFIETDEGLVIAGLNSWGDAPRGIQIGQYGASDYSSRVSQFTDWIEKHSGGTAGDSPDDPDDPDDPNDGDDSDDGSDDDAGDDNGEDSGDDEDNNDEGEIDSDDDEDACDPGGCSTAPVSGLGWAPTLLALGLLRRRERAV